MAKLKFLLLTLLVASLCIFALASCGGGEEPPEGDTTTAAPTEPEEESTTEDPTPETPEIETVEVTFSANGGSFADGSNSYKVTVDKGELLANESFPAREGYTFNGWSAAAFGSELWDFSVQKAESDMTLYAVWTEKSAAVLSVEGAKIEGSAITMLVDYAGTYVGTEDLVFTYKGGYYSLDRSAGTHEEIVVPATFNGIEVQIGEAALGACEAVKTLVLPNGNYTLKYIFNNYQPPNCTAVKILGGTSISEEMFDGYSGLESITLPSSITEIGRKAFQECRGLTALALPAAVEKIGQNAFSGCTALTSLTIPASVTSIGESAFYDCRRLIEVYNLSSLSISKGSTSNGEVGYYALDIYTDASAESKLHTVEDYIFYEKGDTVYLMGYIGNDTALTLPNYKNKNYSIYQYAFYDNDTITDIAIPSSVTGIGEFAFSYCTSLTSITIPEGVTSIGKYAFEDCDSLTSVTFADTSTWYYTTNYNCTGGTQISVSSPSSNATFIKDTYTRYNWYKK